MMKKPLKSTEEIAKAMTKPQKSQPQKKSEEPTDAIGWLKKAYVEDKYSGQGSPKVGKIGYLL
tara:strand:+ start:1308 stop:1496 length:189 start_codon:yes stop_codon:yes gene_type:complete